ncbi:hypothetical protein MACJ_003513 [Theileria orientalis]|uniref:CCR4-Not complex component Not1 C-terminal domain-containing protein n=1 Tax=Theileria orientalis TaxID=68886 RepID=A0A976SKF9_THEOR|nr:hypothetical protein MACJ_003513 [Theileria orientalis]
MFPPPFYNIGLEPGKAPHVFSTQSLRILYSLPHDHEIFSCIIKCLNLVETSGCREVASLAIAKCLLMFISEGPGLHSGLNLEVILCILDWLHSINPAVKQMLANILFSMPLDQNNNLFNIMVVAGLLRYRLLEWPDLTHYFVLAMERGKNLYAIEMAIVVTAIALIDQRSAPPSVAATLLRDLSALNCGTEQCKTHPGVLIEDAKSKLLKDIVDAQNDPKPKPTILVLTTILKQNMSTKVGLQHFKEGTTMPPLSHQVSELKDLLALHPDGRAEESMDGLGGARRVPLPCSVNDSQRFLFGVLFGQWIECSRNVEGDALLFAWRQFFQKFNLQAFFKMEGGTDSFFASCLYTIIHFEKSSKLFALAKNPNALSSINAQAMGSETASVPMSMNGAPANESNTSTPSDARSNASSSSIGSMGSSITLYECFEGLCKMVDVMLRLVGGVGEIPPFSALQKLLSCLSSIIVHEGHYFRSYNIWLSLMVYFDRFDESNYVFSKLTFLYALEYVNPTRVPGFSFFFLRLLVHPSLLTGCLKATKCWSVLARIFTLLSIYTTEINSYGMNDEEFSVASGAQYNQPLPRDDGKQDLGKEKRDDSDFDAARSADYVEYFTCVYFNSIEYIASLCPEFVSVNYLNFFGTFAIERLASSVGSDTTLGPSLGIKGVDLLPEMKVAPKVSNSWANYISRNRTSLLVSKALITLAKYSTSSLPTSQELETLRKILTEEANSNPAQAVMTFNSLTMEIVTNNPSKNYRPSNARLFLFLWLIKSLPLKAKYLIVCSIARHLRGPNAHTFFFSCLAVTMFEECKSDPETTQVILRVLLESFIAPGQCPWGVSLVVVELFRNPRFQLTPNYSPQTNALIDSITYTINNIVV